MYAFVAKNDVQAKALEKNGAVWMPSMGVWIGRDFSSWKLRRLKKKGLVPKATGFPMKTTKPPLKWPRWIKIITLGPPVALAALCIWLAQNTADFPVFNNILFVCGFFIFWSVLIGQFTKLAYAFYRRLRGDRSYWEDMTTNTAPRIRNNEDTFSRNPIHHSPIGDIYNSTTYIGISGNKYTS